MAADTPATVRVESIALHTYNGKEYPVGATYDVDPALLDTLRVQGKARPVAAEHAAEKQAKAESTAVEPMTLNDKAVRTRR